MFHHRFSQNSFAVYISFLAGVTIFSGKVAGQTDNPKTPTHAELYARIAKTPIAKNELKSKSGAALTDEQKADIKKAETSQAQAEADFDAAKYEQAAKAAAAAAQIRASILGDNHYLSVTSRVFADMANRAAALPAADQAKFAEARQALSDWDTLNKEGKYEEARDKAKSALDYAEQNLGEKSPTTALAYLRLGTTLIDLGNYSEALKNLQKSQAMTKSIYGAGHPQYAHVMDRLGWDNVYLAGEGVFSKEQAQAAADALQTAVQIFRSTVGETKDTAESLDNLGTALIYVKRIPEALDSKLRALYIRETLLGPDARDTAVSLSNLAWLYSRIGMSSEVVPLRERALKIFKKLLRPDHPYVYLESANLGWDYHLAGRDDEAVQIFEKLVAQDESREDKGRPDVVQRLSRLAEIYAATGKFDAARSRMDEAFEAIKNLHAGAYAEQAVNILGNLARAADRARMFVTAERFYAQLCEWAGSPKSKVGDADRGVYEMFYGSALLDNGKAKEAKQVLTDSISHLDDKKDKSRARLIEPLIYLSRAESDLGDHGAATKHADMAVQIAESTTSKRNFSTAFTQLWLGRAYAKAGNTSMAQFCMKDAQKTFDKLKDRDPTGSILVRIELGQVYLRESKRDEAIKQLKEALTTCRDLQKKFDNAQLNALTARVLYTLYDATSDGGAAPSKRDEWKQDALSILNKLASNGLLNAEEKAWLKKNG